MRSPFATLQSMTLPSGAGPNAPAIVVGLEPVPPELVTFYAADPVVIGGYTVVQGSIWRRDATHYWYEVLLVEASTLFPAKAAGQVITGVVSEAARQVMGAGFPSISYGMRNQSDIYVQSGCDVIISGNLIVNSSAGQGVSFIPGTPFTIDAISAPRGLRGAMSYTGGGLVAASTGTTEVAVPSATWTTEPTFTFEGGRLYRLGIMGMMRAASAVSSATTILVRKGAATTSGAVLASLAVQIPSSGAVALVGFYAERYIRNSTGSAVATKLSLTNQRVTGTASIELYGDANQPLAVVVEDVGIASQQTGLTAAPSV